MQDNKFDFNLHVNNNQLRTMKSEKVETKKI